MKQKILRIVLAVAVVLSMVSSCLPALAAVEATGICSGSTYYIKSIYTNKYLSVYGSSNASGTNVLTEAFTGSNNQIWTVTLLSNGYYTLMPACAANSYLDVYDNYTQSGSNIDIWAGSSSDVYLQWQIARNTGAFEEGSYYLTSRCSNDTMYLHEDISTYNVEQYNTKDEFTAWSFEKVSKGDADIISTNDDYTRSGNDSVFVSSANAMGYNGGAYPNTAAPSALSWMRYDNGFVHNGHGLPAQMLFYNNGADTYVTYSDINNLPSNDLAGLRFLITTGCSSAKNDNSGNNIINSLYNKGAQFALGWTIDISAYKGSNWVKFFMQTADDGNKVSKCIEQGDYWANPGPKYYKGDLNQILSR